MQVLRSFPPDGTDFAVHIVDYRGFGRCLLEDNDGVKVASIAATNQGNVVNINDDIFNEFLIGRGKRPMNWRSFIECLEKSGLYMLSEKILGQMETKERGKCMTILANCFIRRLGGENKGMVSGNDVLLYCWYSI